MATSPFLHFADGFPSPGANPVSDSSRNWSAQRKERGRGGAWKFPLTGALARSWRLHLWPEGGRKAPPFLRASRRVRAARWDASLVLQRGRVHVRPSSSLVPLRLLAVWPQRRATLVRPVGPSRSWAGAEVTPVCPCTHTRTRRLSRGPWPIQTKAVLSQP